MSDLVEIVAQFVAFWILAIAAATGVLVLLAVMGSGGRP